MNENIKIPIYWARLLAPLNLRANLPDIEPPEAVKTNSPDLLTETFMVPLNLRANLPDIEPVEAEK